MANEPYAPGTICKIKGTDKRIKILHEIKLDIIPKGGEPSKLQGHLYEVEHLTEKKMGDKTNYPGDVLAPLQDSNEIHLAGIHQALDWVIDVLDGKTNTWLLPKDKCDKIKGMIAKLRNH